MLKSDGNAKTVEMQEQWLPDAKCERNQQKMKTGTPKNQLILFTSDNIIRIYQF
jgi:hypothetical protein